LQLRVGKKEITFHNSLNRCPGRTRNANYNTTLYACIQFQ